jgi:hypothetical protein
MGIKKAYIEYCFEHEVFDYTLNGVLIHPATRKKLSFRRGRKQLKDFTMRKMVNIKQFNGCDIKLRMDQHCSYSTILT